jgi:hypothetical protein
MILESKLSLTDSFEPEYLEYYSILPLEVIGGRLRVAAAGTPATEVLEDLERTFGAPATLVAAEPDDIAEAVRELFSAAQSTDALVRSLGADDQQSAHEETLEADARDLANQPPVVRYDNL